MGLSMIYVLMRSLSPPPTRLIFQHLPKNWTIEHARKWCDDVEVGDFGNGCIFESRCGFAWRHFVASG